MTKEALKLALEALGAYMSATDSEEDAKAHSLMAEAFFKIKEALAQDEQEPVAYINVEQHKLEWAKYMSWYTPTVVNLPKIPLYTTPPNREWVGLTNDEVNNLAAGCHLGNSVQDAIYKAAAKLQDKNT